MSKIHRHFHYNPDTGRSTPVEPVKLPDGGEILIPVQLNEKGEKVEPPKTDTKTDETGK